MINLGGLCGFKTWTTRKFDVSVACIVDVFVARELGVSGRLPVTLKSQNVVVWGEFESLAR